MEKECSTFNMSKKEYVVLFLLRFGLSLLSLSILSPFLIYLEYKREAENTIIDGYSLRFKGKLKDIVLIYYIWLFITALIVSLYLYLIDLFQSRLLTSLPPIVFSILSSSVVTLLSSVFLKSRVRKWRYRSTIIEDQDDNSFFSGNMILVIIYAALRKILAFISIGLFYPLMKQLNLRYECRGIKISSRSLKVENENWLLMKIWLKSLFILIITLGIYWPFLSYRLKKTMIEHIHMEN